MVETTTYDLAIIGGGINGAGIARDAAGRGLKVLLVEKGDIASATSSASSKLIHGGLRYLEYGEFRLVRESLHERERLLKIAPHIIKPLDFLMPTPSEGALRPSWMVTFGLKLYDLLAGGASSLPRSRYLHLDSHSHYHEGLKSNITKAHRYSDCWVDDARLVLLNAMDAKERGATILTRTECLGIKALPNHHWQLDLETTEDEPHLVEARMVINATGPWANNIAKLAGVTTKGHVKQVQGSHIIVPRIYEDDHACLLQMPDKRIIFLLPFEGEFTLIGTTDQAYDGDASDAAITGSERDYLIEGANRYLAKPISHEDVVWSYSGVRALYDDHSKSLSAMTRDYVLEVSEYPAPFLSVFGGKLTTYRKLAESVIEKLTPYFPDLKNTPSWTADALLIGGDMTPAQLKEALDQSHPFLPDDVLTRWLRQYGTRITTILDHVTSFEEMGHEIAPGVFECELVYAQRHEWVQKGEDFLWRRTKLGVHLRDDERKSVRDWFFQNPA